MAEVAVASHVRDLIGPDKFRADGAYPNHLRNWEQNLIQGIDLPTIKSDIGKGAGGELREGSNGSPAKFCAAYSSTALCVNSFGCFRQSPHQLCLGNLTNFTSASFEAVCSTGISSPHLDFFVSSTNAAVGVESKFLEPLRDTEPKFSERYQKVFRECGDEVLERVFRSITSDPGQWKRLDVAQLLKHSLGILRSHENLETLVLLYVYWEPEDFHEIKPFLDHRNEIDRFATLMEGCRIRFLSSSYSDLWEGWTGAHTFPDAKNHVSALKERYSIRLAPPE